MESPTPAVRVSRSLQLTTIAVVLAGVFALNMWFVPTLQAVYESAELAVPASLLFAVTLSRYWWLACVVAAAAYWLLGRGMDAEANTNRRNAVISTVTLLSVLYFVWYAMTVTQEYAGTVDLTAAHLGELRDRIKADSVRAAATALPDSAKR